MKNVSDVLGLSQEHDSGIALVHDGTIVFASNEERYTRKKFQSGMPNHAIAKLGTFPVNIAVASNFHVGPGLGNWLALDWKAEVLERIFSMAGLDRIVWGSAVGPKVLIVLGKIQQIFRRRQIAQVFAGYGVKHPVIKFFDHHTAHAATAYYGSGWKECMVITQDASGDGYCSKVFVCKNGEMFQKTAIPFFHSPGHYYEYVTILFGFKIGREGKVTGLAARGNPDYTYPIFARELSYDFVKKHYINHGLYRKAEIKRLRRLLDGFSREDIAAGVQKHLETIMCAYIRDQILLHAPKIPVNLAVAGGVFANVRLNQKIAALPQVRELFVYPHMTDGGLAAGAAFLFSPQKPKKIEHVYLGDDIANDDIQNAIALYQDHIVITKSKKMPSLIAHFLSQGLVVAIVRGRMEYGPRALGHRSLLSQATDPSVNDWLNKRLKRSEFMPFAPILKAEDVPRYFYDYQKVLPSLPYMTVTLQANELCKKEAPAIVHVDGTARPQIVYKKTESFIYEILEVYRKKTGLGILINTSFNIHEEPIVRTADDAVKTFLDGHIDVLVLGDMLIRLKR